MQTLNVIVKGIRPLLVNNPQTVDRFNPLAKQMAAINAKKTRRTDDDYRELADLEVEAKLYFDPKIGVYVPATWVLNALANGAFKLVKRSKADVRGSVFTTEDKLALSYKGMNKVKTAKDIIGNPEFRHSMGVVQGQVRVMKSFPCFHDWSFNCVIEFDDKIVDPADIKKIVEHTAKYGGYGDFRPTFGRAVAEVSA